MKVLLDTHILLWALSDDSRLPVKARKLIENPDNEIFYSVVSAWEIEIKKLAHPDSMPIGAEETVAYCVEAGFHCASIRNDHIFLLKSLHRSEGSAPHRDPFDRIMICQAMSDDMIFVTHDSLLADYEEPCIFTV